MTYGDLAIDLRENMTKVTSIGIVASYHMPLITPFHHSWFPRQT